MGRMNSSEMMVKRKMQPKTATILEMSEVQSRPGGRTQEVVEVVGPRQVARVRNVAHGRGQLPGQILAQVRDLLVALMTSRPEESIGWLELAAATAGGPLLGAAVGVVVLLGGLGLLGALGCLIAQGVLGRRIEVSGVAVGARGVVERAQPFLGLAERLWMAMPPVFQVRGPLAGAARKTRCIRTETAVVATMRKSAMARCHVLMVKRYQIWTRIGWPVSLMLRSIVVMAMMARPIQKRLKKPWKSR
ncbi:hypothetical protein HYQ46_003798 [Verticillium longisporum]|nr:hypothetical protein HYQ46_003798 [Verticillium longisporum]